jgi:predicted NUDIX family NTP pyrophosphohydrolase
MCRLGEPGLEVLLAHPGGPYFVKKDEGVWTIPKGLIEASEDPLAAAVREFEEETGFSAAARRYQFLGDVTQKGGKRVLAWAFWGDCDPAALHSNTFEIEWPPRSGRTQTFPEIDRAAFFSPAVALQKILPAQQPFIDRCLGSFSHRRR